ncbi:MAG: carboxymuconolactone decarboxylase family protein [Actinomycetes bacterium]
MARIEIPEGKGPEMHRVWMLRPEMAVGAGALADAVYDKSQLPPRVREAARMRVAMRNDCQICLGWRDATLVQAGVDENLYAAVRADNLSELDERVTMAVEFADRFATDHLSIDDEVMGRLRRLFSDAEILDLSICCANWVGMGRLNQVLGLDTGCTVHQPVAGPPGV